MTWPYDCPHLAGERGAAWCRLLNGAGCPVYWRTGSCTVCLGEWGAWRAVLGSLLASPCGWYVVERGNPRRDWQIAHSHWGLLSAVGWSP